MKRIELNFNKYQKELEKLNEQLERAKITYEKKYAIAQKYGVADWSCEDRNNWLLTVEITESGFIVNKVDGKKNGAWFDLFCARERIQEKEKEIKRAETRLYNAEQKVNKYYEELEKIADLKAKEKLMQERFEQEQKEWKKDNIILESRYLGFTPNGKRFAIVGNNGYAERSLHCVQLIIDGETIFTSGEFWRAYAEIKKR